MPIFRTLCLPLLAALLSVSPLSASAQTPPAGVRMTPGGAFSWDGLNLAVTYFSPAWDSVDQTQMRPARGAPSASTPGWVWETAGNIPVAGQKGQIWTLEQRFTRVGEQDMKMDYRADFPSGYPGGALCLVISLPIETGAGGVVRVDQQAVPLPATFTTSELFKRTAKSVTLPTASGSLTLSGNFYAYVQDSRKWGGTTFQIRLHFTSADQTLNLAATYSPQGNVR